jgi:hypothetical protein
MQLHLHVHEVPDAETLAILREIRTTLTRHEALLEALRLQGERLMTVGSDVLNLCQQIDAASNLLAASSTSIQSGIDEVGRDLAALRALVGEGAIDATTAADIKARLDAIAPRLDGLSLTAATQASVLEQLGRDPEAPVPPIPPPGEEIPVEGVTGSTT